MKTKIEHASILQASWKSSKLWGVNIIAIYCSFKGFQFLLQSCSIIEELDNLLKYVAN
jgi:hypothetical protein